MVVTVRSDFEPQAAAELGELWGSGPLPVPGFGPEELREVILGPAGAKGRVLRAGEARRHTDPQVSGEARRRAASLADAQRPVPAGPGSAPRDQRRPHAHRGGRRRPRRARRRPPPGGELSCSTRRTPRRRRRSGGSSCGSPPRKRRPGPDASTGTSSISATQKTTAWAASSTATRRPRLLVVGSDGERDYVEPAHDALVPWDKQLEWLAQSGSQKVIRDAWIAADDWEHRDGKRKRRNTSGTRTRTCSSSNGGNTNRSSTRSSESSAPRARRESEFSAAV